jgi:hypothetical protein
MRFFVKALLIALVVVLPLSHAVAQSSNTLINYQCQLADSEGNPVEDSTYSITFSIWSDPTAGDQLWTETHAVPIDGGMFSVALGSVVPLPVDVIGALGSQVDFEVYLEVQLLGDTPIQPRTRLTAVPYSAASQRVSGDIITEPGAVSVGEAIDIADDDESAVITLIQRPTGKSLFDKKIGVDLNAYLVINDILGETLAVYSGMGAEVTEQAADEPTRKSHSFNDYASVLFMDTTADTLAVYSSAGLGIMDYGKTVVEIGSDANGGYVLVVDRNSGNTPEAKSIDPDDARGIIFKDTLGDTLAVYASWGVGFPDGTYQTTAASPGGGNWAVTDSVLYTNDYWGIARGGVANMLYGDSAHTMVNLGVACTTGTNGQNYYYSTVSGGFGNAARHARSVVGGGYKNTVTSFDATVGGGLQNTASGGVSTVSGGGQNTASAQHATVGGGNDNTASGMWSTVAGGLGNQASGPSAAIGGGVDDTSKAVYGGVSAGYSNLAGDELNDSAAYVGGGYNNSATAKHATVGGGYSNTASGDHSTVAGGYNNSSLGTIGGGYGNATGNASATVGGGSENLASAYLSTVSGGGINQASTGSTVGGGLQNVAAGNYSVIGGGYSHTANAVYGGVFAGVSNIAGDEAGDTAALVSGGSGNSATAKYTTVGGGYSNTASVLYATVGGGRDNTASDNEATVAGGGSNTADADYSTVSGGFSNVATTEGFANTVSGGYENSNAGSYSAIPGGSQDTLTATADCSMAFGQQVYVNFPYRVVFFDSTNPGYLGINRDDHDGGISYPIHVGTGTTNGNGAYLSAGGTWSNGSSRRFKEKFEQLEGREVLDRIDALPAQSWQYKGTGERHIWPCAEDFHRAFDVGVLNEDGTRDTMYLAAGDVAGVALVGVQELYRMTRQLHAKTLEIEQLRAEMAQMQALIDVILARQGVSIDDTGRLAGAKH